jgi:hypothetical protein
MNDLDNRYIGYMFHPCGCFQCFDTLFWKLDTHPCSLHMQVYIYGGLHLAMHMLELAEEGDSHS